MLDGEADSHFIALLVKGKGVYPNLSFEPAEIVLPPHPLGVPSSVNVVVTSQVRRLTRK